MKLSDLVRSSVHIGPLLTCIGLCFQPFFSQILAMIEEAAGTRMYECKKISAQKTIEKKEAKLKEIQTVCYMFY